MVAAEHNNFYEHISILHFNGTVQNYVSNSVDPDDITRICAACKYLQISPCYRIGAEKA